jgi:hypothetical protein
MNATARCLLLRVARVRESPMRERTALLTPFSPHAPSPPWQALPFLHPVAASRRCLAVVQALQAPAISNSNQFQINFKSKTPGVTAPQALASPSTLHHPPSIRHPPPSTPTLHSTLHLPPSTSPSTLHHPLSTRHPPPSTLHSPLSTFHPPPSYSQPPLAGSELRRPKAEEEGGGVVEDAIRRPERPREPPLLWDPSRAPQRWSPRCRPDVAGHAQVALGRMRSHGPLRGLGVTTGVPPRGPKEERGVVTGVRVGGSHELCAPKGLLVGHYGG